MGETRNTYKFLVRKPEEKRPLGRPSHRWKIILTWIWENRVLCGSIWSRRGKSGRLLRVW